MPGEESNSQAEIVDTTLSAWAEETTSRVVGEDESVETGSVTIRATVTVECSCGNDVTVMNTAQSVVCQTCGRRWSS
jgi:hypothetical protein